MSPNTDRSTRSSQKKNDPDWDVVDQLQPRLSDTPQPSPGLIARGQFTSPTASYNPNTQTAQPYTRPRNAGQPEKPLSNSNKYPQHVQPTQGQSGHGRPPHNAQRGHDPGYGHSSHGQPVYPQPGYGHSSPGHPQPGYDHSSRGQPVSPQPGYGHSSHDKSGYAYSPVRDTKK